MTTPNLPPGTIATSPVLQVPTAIDYQPYGMLIVMSRPRTLPEGTEGIDWIWDTKGCRPLVSKACESCKEASFMRIGQRACSQACGTELAKQTRPDYHGDANPKWRGNNAKYLARHVRVRTARGKASGHDCECGLQAFEWAHVHDTDPFDVQNYRPMCVKCHRAYDKPMVLRGESHPLTKLTESNVLVIRERYATGKETQTALAAEFGVLQGTIHKIVSGKTWREVMPS